MTGMTELLKGALEGVVLAHIAQGETYGYEITQYLTALGFDEIVEGTVYTVLLRLEKKGLLAVARRKSPLGPQRKFYTLNEAGKAYLAAFWEKWQFLATTMTHIQEGKA
ncbi:PadR family transcriptional regulator [Lacticaseibacillus baoqingensis]|uniref:PadR family transcriptional regulator n=1 Tax=Lacticaseibacillus baoqingensis TaxID=2486013 RepID=A0ABW4E7R8_9LACO